MPTAFTFVTHSRTHPGVGIPSHVILVLVFGLTLSSTVDARDSQLNHVRQVQSSHPFAGATSHFSKRDDGVNELTPFSGFVPHLAPDSTSRLRPRTDLRKRCLTSEVSCGNGFCIPAGSLCCSTADGSYCPAAQVCVTGGCCPSSTPYLCPDNRCATSSSACTSGSSCGIGGKTCGSTCAPAGYNCCGSDGTYCSISQVCVTGGCCKRDAPYLCPDGQNCVQSLSYCPGAVITTTTTTTVGLTATARSVDGQSSATTGSSSSGLSSGVITGLAIAGLVVVGILLATLRIMARRGTLCGSGSRNAPQPVALAPPTAGEGHAFLTLPYTPSSYPPPAGVPAPRQPSYPPPPVPGGMNSALAPYGPPGGYQGVPAAMPPGDNPFASAQK